MISRAKSQGAELPGILSCCTQKSSRVFVAVGFCRCCFLEVLVKRAWLAFLEGERGNRAFSLTKLGG